jgi:methylated-DNA-[protein]-cysteine S-methyltransferase
MSSVVTHERGLDAIRRPGRDAARANGRIESYRFSKERIMKLFLSHLDSPLGAMLLVTDAERVVRALEFADHKARLHRGLREHYGEVELTEIPAPAGIADALARYFAGELEALNALQTATAGSDVQRRAWAALRRIPAGATVSYGRLAKELGFVDPRAAIDIGAANGANPIAVIVPCHRVVAGNGDLKGYAWGLHRKRWLLGHEKAMARKDEEPQSATLPGF